MDRIKELRSLAAKAAVWLADNKELVKKAALPVTVAVAVLFFRFCAYDPGGEEIGESDAAEALSEAQAAAGEDGELIAEDAEEAGSVFVDISGCVARPGVYEVQAGTRLFEVIDKAGGVTEGADIDGINRAEKVTDGQKVIIYSKEDASAPAETGAGGSDGGAGAVSGRINLNRAGSEELQSIPGIGPSTAQKILRYREENGYFSSIEEIKNVSGIGEKTFEKMKDYLTV